MICAKTARPGQYMALRVMLVCCHASKVRVRQLRKSRRCRATCTQHLAGCQTRYAVL